MEEKKAATQTLIESIGQEKAVVDAAVESSRGDEEAAATLQVGAAFLSVLEGAHATVSTAGILCVCCWHTIIPAQTANKASP